MDELNRAIREAEEFLLQAKTEEIREVLRRKYFELLKRKYEEPKVSVESNETREPMEPMEPLKPKDSRDPRDVEENLPVPTLPKVVKDMTKLHALQKFKIDHETMEKLFHHHKGRVHEFFVHLARILPKYFENNTEMIQYIKNKCYVGLRAKEIFSKDVEDMTEEYFVPHGHKRRYLAQTLNDIREIIFLQVPIIEGDIAEFIRNESGYIVTGIKSVKLEVTPFKPRIREARGYIPLYPWLQGRRDIVNIQNKDNLCFWKCLYRVFNPDPRRHDNRDVPASQLQEFMISHGFEYSIFNDGYTTENLALFKERYQISVNIYDVGKDSLEQTRQYYCSIYNGDPDDNVIKVNLGILRNEEGDVHFVLVKKLQTIFITKNHEMHGHVKMCQDCGIVCSTTEQLLRHYKFEHKNETKGQQELVLPPIPEKAWIQFNLEEKHDFQKTQRYFFVCYADFECSNIPVQDPGTKKTKILTRQIPNSFMVFCPDLMFLEDKRSLSIDSI
jgi:hypothetical protein